MTANYDAALLNTRSGGEHLMESRRTDLVNTPSGGEGGGLPRVDVVVATRNRPELLQLALDAIWDQDYEGEIVTHVVFDQCPVDTGVLREGDQRAVVALENERHPGLAGARNTGIANGSASWVAFCDDDDEWRPSKVRLQVEEVSRTGAVAAVTGITVRYSDASVDRVPSRDDMQLRNLMRNRVMEAHPSTLMVSRDALEARIGLVDEELPGSYAEDFDFMIRTVQAGELCVVAEPLVLVRWGQSMFSQRWETIVEAVDYLIDKHALFAEDNLAHARLLGRKSFALAAMGRRRGAVACAMRTLRLNPRERRAVLALSVATGVVSAESLMKIAHRRGHGI